MIFPTIFVFTLICFQVVCHMHLFTYTSASDKHLYQMIHVSCKKYNVRRLSPVKQELQLSFRSPLIHSLLLVRFLQLNIQFAVQSFAACCLSFCTLVLTIALSCPLLNYVFRLLLYYLYIFYGYAGCLSLTNMDGVLFAQEIILNIRRFKPFFGKNERDY